MRVWCFQPRTGLPLGVKENEVTRWARNPDQLFLEFTKNCFDAGTVTWETILRVHTFGIRTHRHMEF
jgi:hypothetical protein